MNIQKMKWREENNNTKPRPKTAKKNIWKHKTGKERLITRIGTKGVKKGRNDKRKKEGGRKEGKKLYSLAGVGSQVSLKRLAVL